MKHLEKLKRVIVGPFYFSWGRGGLVVGSTRPDVARHLHFVPKRSGLAVHATDETQPKGRRSLASAWIPMRRAASFGRDLTQATLGEFLARLELVDPEEYSRRGYWINSGRRGLPVMVRKHLRFKKRSVRLWAGKPWSWEEVRDVLVKSSFPFSDLDRFRHQPPGSVGAWRVDEDGEFHYVTLFYAPYGWINGRPPGWYAIRKDSLDFSKVTARIVMKYMTPGFIEKWDELVQLSGLKESVPTANELRSRLREVAWRGRQSS